MARLNIPKAKTDKPAKRSRGPARSVSTPGKPEYHKQVPSDPEFRSAKGVPRRKKRMKGERNFGPMSHVLLPSIEIATGAKFAAQVAAAREAGVPDDSLFVPAPNIWDTAPRMGRYPSYEDPATLAQACTEYFDWVTNNPLYETKPMQAGGGIEMVNIPRMRPMTIVALCLFIGVPSRLWMRWKDPKGTHYRPHLLPVMEAVEEVIYQQKFEGAAAKFLDASIISRDLGLAERHELSGPGGGPMQTEGRDLGAVELARRLAFLLETGAAEQQKDQG